MTDPAGEQVPEPALGKQVSTCPTSKNPLKALERKAPGFIGNGDWLTGGQIESLERQLGF